MTDYYSHCYVSNSDLTALELELMPAVVKRDYQKALDFGILFHAMILEPETVDHIRRTVRDHQYSIEDFNAAKRMRDAVRMDQFSQDLIRMCEKEVEMYNAGTVFEYNGTSFTLDTRRKYDLWNRIANFGADFKSTTATNQTSFVNAVQRFSYDRSRVFYAKGSGAKKDVIIGVSKTNFKIFPVFMREGCPLWLEGERKVNELAYKYKNLKVPA
jgi:hypothetical protein